MEIRELGRALAKLRKEQRVTQEEMCAYMGVSRVTLSLFENGKKTSLSLSKLGVMLDRLGLELEIKEKGALPTLDEMLET